MVLKVVRGKILETLELTWRSTDCALALGAAKRSRGGKLAFAMTGGTVPRN